MAKVLRICPHCGCELVKARSPRHHRFFFAVIAHAYENWPEAHDFQPDSAEHLRAWLLTHTKHKFRLGNGLNAEKPDPLKMVDFVEMCLFEVRKSGYGFVVMESNGEMTMHFPKSINYAELDQEEFAPIADDVFAVIEAEMKTTIKELSCGFTEKHKR